MTRMSDEERKRRNRERMQKRYQRIKNDPEFKAKGAAYHARNKNDPDYQARRMKTPDQMERARQRERSRQEKLKDDPIFIAKRRANSARWSERAKANPELRRKYYAANNAYQKMRRQNDAEFRAARASYLKIYASDPNNREKLKLYHLEYQRRLRATKQLNLEYEAFLARIDLEANEGGK